MTYEQQDREPPVALVTGASRGLGLALAGSLASRGWRLILAARDRSRLAAAAQPLAVASRVTVLAGDVADPVYRRALAGAVGRAGRLDLLVNNASVLGPSPLRTLAASPLAALEQVYAVNTFAPLGLIQLLLPYLQGSAGRIVNISSDAAVEPYEGWGGYGSAKAALDHLTAVLAVELPGLRVYAFDPGEMATDLHQQAFPGEDISDRPDPGSVVPGLLQLIERELPSGRYRVEDLRGPVAPGADRLAESR